MSSSSIPRRFLKSEFSSFNRLIPPSSCSRSFSPSSLFVICEIIENLFYCNCFSICRTLSTTWLDVGISLYASWGSSDRYVFSSSFYVSSKCISNGDSSNVFPCQAKLQEEGKRYPHASHQGDKTTVSRSVWEFLAHRAEYAAQIIMLEITVSIGVKAYKNGYDFSLRHLGLSLAASAIVG